MLKIEEASSFCYISAKETPLHPHDCVLRQVQMSHLRRTDGISSEAPHRRGVTSGCFVQITSRSGSTVFAQASTGRSTPNL